MHPIIVPAGEEGTGGEAELVDEGGMGACESCEYTKTMRRAIWKERVAPSFGDEAHSDVWMAPRRTTGE